MSLALLAVAGLLFAGGLIAYFLKLESEGRSHVVVLIILWFLLAEMVFQPDGFDARIGLFRIPLGSLDARPADLIVPLALAARALSAAVPRRLSIAALIWAAFILWYTVGAAIGLLNNHLATDVIGQLRGVLVGAGLMILVAGIDVNKLLANDRVPRAGRIIGFIAIILLATHFSGISADLNVPVVGFTALGALGSDARTLFPVLGVMAIIMEISGGRRRLSVIIPSLALIATPIAATQGGPYLSLLVMLISLTIIAMGATWKRRLKLTATDIGFVLSLVLGVGAISVFASGGESPVLVEQFEEAVLSDTQSTTTGERLLLWSDALDEIGESPVWGDGLGVFGTIERPFPAKVAITTFHNVLFDIAARTGLAGLGLFLAALSATFVRAMVTWRRNNEPYVAALALTSMIGVLGILGRALVSSSFEHTRVTVALFLLIGLVLAAEKTGSNGADANGSELSRPQPIDHETDILGIGGR